MSIGKVIKALRIERGWTQEELARIANVGVNSITSAERGKRRPQKATISGIAYALDTTVEQLEEQAQQQDNDKTKQIIAHLSAAINLIKK